MPIPCITVVSLPIDWHGPRLFQNNLSRPSMNVKGDTSSRANPLGIFGNESLNPCVCHAFNERRALKRETVMTLGIQRCLPGFPFHLISSVILDIMPLRLGKNDEQNEVDSLGLGL